uniref:Protein MMS22-like n=1 Tax=Anthurium amnicola TaxID=1678845 RepID=A0A1D1YHH4_9ARAE
MTNPNQNKDKGSTFSLPIKATPLRALGSTAASRASSSSFIAVPLRADDIVISSQLMAQPQASRSDSQPTKSSRTVGSIKLLNTCSLIGSIVSQHQGRFLPPSLKAESSCSNTILEIPSSPSKSTYTQNLEFCKTSIF